MNPNDSFPAKKKPLATIPRSPIEVLIDAAAKAIVWPCCGDHLMTAKQDAIDGNNNGAIGAALPALESLKKAVSLIEAAIILHGENGR